AMLASSAEAIPPLGCAGVRVPGLAVGGHDARLHEGLAQGQNPLVCDSSTHPFQHSGVRDVVEARFDIRVQHPLVSLGAEGVYLGDRVMGPAPRTEAVAHRREVRLQDRCQDQHEAGLHKPVHCVGIPSLSCPPLPGSGIMRSRTSSGVNVPSVNCSRTSPKKTTMSASSAMKAGTRSTPAVPLLPLTLS